MFGTCKCSFCVYVVLCLGRGLPTSWSPVQGILSSVKWSWNWKSETRAQVGCRASGNKYKDSFFIVQFGRIVVINAVVTARCVVTFGAPASAVHLSVLGAQNYVLWRLLAANPWRASVVSKWISAQHTPIACQSPRVRPLLPHRWLHPASTACPALHSRRHVKLPREYSTSQEMFESVISNFLLSTIIGPRHSASG
jgi:hypothetical protein